MALKKVSCVIAAYNEEKGIGTVLNAVVGHPLIKEIIVVDDCSHDRTGEIAKSFKGVKLIRHEVNKGKTLSVADAIEAARGEYICSLDGDLIGITADSVTRLITPVLDGIADVSISLRENCPWFYRPIHLDYISGERVYSRAFLMEHLDELRKLPKFGLEVFMNDRIIEKKYRVAIVYLPGVISPLKYQKEGLWTGLVADMRMFGDIFKTVSLWECIFQIASLLELRIKLPQAKPQPQVKAQVSSSK